jgi:hypothetical protein
MHGARLRLLQVWSIASPRLVKHDKLHVKNGSVRRVMK